MKKVLLFLATGLSFFAYSARGQEEEDRSVSAMEVRAPVGRESEYAGDGRVEPALEQELGRACCKEPRLINKASEDELAALSISV